jgi:hypothetical protein
MVDTMAHEMCSLSEKKIPNPNKPALLIADSYTTFSEEVQRQQAGRQ